MLKKFYNHQIFLSVALSETGAVHGVRVRSIWPILAVFLIVTITAASSFMSYHARAQLVAMLSGKGLSEAYLEQIDQLENEQAAYSQQVQLIAKELGVLEARLARFDALGERLLSDEMLAELLATEGDDADPFANQGGPEELDFGRTYSLDDVRQQLGLMRQKADRAQFALESGLALSLKNQNAAAAPYFFPVLHPRMHVSSHYGWRTHPITKHRHLHGGTDIAAGWDAPIVSAGDGVVVYAGYRYEYGITVEIRHANGFSTRYGHMSKATVRNGDAVSAGDLIGLMGSTGRSTGPHLHFEILKDDEKMNPYPFIRGHRDTAKRLAQAGRGAELVAAWKSQQAAQHTAKQPDAKQLSQR